jgi:hypothetical protein
VQHSHRDGLTTTALLPLMGMLQRSRSSMQPLGVQGTKSGSRPCRCVHADGWCGWSKGQALEQVSVYHMLSGRRSGVDVAGG